MFYPHADALLLSEAGLQGLRLSLNTPVVSAEELPSGPARAAIVAHAGEYGDVQVFVALRQVGGSATALYAYHGAGGEPDPPGVALEAALGFAESFGFLFDDDEVGGGSTAERRKAFERWQAFSAGAAAVEPLDPAALELETVDDDGELELELDPDDELPSPGASAAAPERARPRRPALSKFRTGAAGPASDARAASGGSALGRVPIVKRRADPDAGEAPDPRLEIFGSY